MSRFARPLLCCVAILATSHASAGTAAEAVSTQTNTLPVLVRSARSGPWSASSTWEGGKLPAPGARVQIRAGHTVRYDLSSDQAIRSIHVAGTLSFARDRDTRLDVGLIKIQPGSDATENGFDCDAHLPAMDPSHARPALEVGTAEQPISPDHTGRIRLVYFDGMDRQSCPAIVCCGGRMEFHGAPMNRTWVKLGATAKAGDSSVTLSQPVTGWRVGDHLILTATQRVGTGSESGTFRPGAPAARAAAGEPAGSANGPAEALTASREARFACEIATKFSYRGGSGGGKGGEPGGDPAAGALASARVGLWAAETAKLRHTPGKEAAVAGVMAARAALAAVEHGDPTGSTGTQAALATARSALTAAEAALARNVSDREATDDAIAAARAAITAAETAKIVAPPEQEAALKASLLEIVAGERHRSPLPAFTEERTVAAIDGVKITLDRPLENDHRAVDEYRGEVADLSRNVIIESADPAGERGHTMHHRGSAGSISYAEFRHLGKEGVLGRYSLHFHLVGNTMRGASVIGASIWDSGNRWITIHGTNYLVVRDCVGYQSVGHGFYLEDGTEQQNVLDRNLAVQAFAGRSLPKQNLPFDPNNGAGFWWANSLNTFTRNVACECDGYGYRFEATPTEGFDLRLAVQQPDGSARRVDIRTLPFVRFEENEAHSILYGLNLGQGADNVGPDSRHPFVVRNTRLWNAQWAFQPNVPSMLVDGMDIYASRYGLFKPIYDHHAYKGLTISRTQNPGGEFIVPLGQKPEGMEFPREESERSPARGGTAVEKRAAAQGYLPFAKAALKTGEPGKTPSGAERSPAEARTRFLRLDADPLSEPPSATPPAPIGSAAFPKPLDPVDDLPPATVITSVQRAADGQLVVRGTTSDNGPVKRVLVNGREARPMSPNFTEWEITLDHPRGAELRLTAHAEDAAGNIEKLAHEAIVDIDGMLTNR